jgi:signal transduction histidine kinase
VRDASGDVPEWVLTTTTAHDESQQLIEGLRRSLVQKDDALIAVAHEMRSPLAPIASAVKLLERRGSDPDCVADMRALISRQVTQLARLVEDLLDMGRLERRQLGVHKERTDLRRVLAAAVETAQPIIAARNHQLTTTVLADGAVIEGDAGRLTQVVVNLLVNAAKFTDSGGRIRVSLERERSAFVIKVRDTGIGISPEMLPRIFDPYVRLEARGGSGLGLGLALARELVQLHGGALIAHRAGVGRGSEFMLELPVPKRRNAADGE